MPRVPEKKEVLKTPSFFKETKRTQLNKDNTVVKLLINLFQNSLMIKKPQLASGEKKLLLFSKAVLKYRELLLRRSEHWPDQISKSEVDQFSDEMEERRENLLQDGIKEELLDQIERVIAQNSIYLHPKGNDLPEVLGKVARVHSTLDQWTKN